MKVYVAGPMRGLPDLNYPAFDAARDLISKLGHEPVSPADLDRETGVTEESAQAEDFIAGALRRDFAALVTCDAIAFLPGWKNSVGANAERRVAEDIGLELYDVEPETARFERQSDGFEVIGLSGYAQSGKDTIAAYLVEHDGWERVAFADTLREAVYTLDPTIKSQVFGEYRHRALRSVVDEFGWDAAKTSPVWGDEVRQLLQRMGTDVGRQLLGDNVWVDLAMRKLEPGHKYVFTDVRFPNEAEAIKRVGGHMWRVKRPNCGPVNGHVSETALDTFLFDDFIWNDSTVADLQERTRWAALSIRP